MSEDLQCYTMKEVAKLFRLSERTLYKYIRNGMLKGMKFGQKWVFTKAQLEAFIERMEKKHKDRRITFKN